MTNDERNSNDQPITGASTVRISSFGFLSDFGFRTSGLFIWHLIQAARFEALQEFPGRLMIKLRVGGLDAKKKTINRGAAELRHVKDWMVRLRQPVEHQHGD